MLKVDFLPVQRTYLEIDERISNVQITLKQAAECEPLVRVCSTLAWYFFTASVGSNSKHEPVFVTEICFWKLIFEIN